MSSKGRKQQKILKTPTPKQLHNIAKRTREVIKEKKTAFQFLKLTKNELPNSD